MLSFVSFTITFLAILACVHAFRVNRQLQAPSMALDYNVKKVATVSVAAILAFSTAPTLSSTAATGTPQTSIVTADSGSSIPAIGSAAPDFSLPSNRGKSINLSDLKGKRSVLYFYPGDFTQGCTIEAQAFQRDLSQYQSLGVDIFGVSVDSVDKHLDFSKSYGLGFPLLSDNGGVVSKSYGSLLDLGFLGKFSNRQTYILSPDLKIEAVFTDVESRLSKHSDEVLAKLRVLSSEK
jgi:thioredoxin-dependent peroxiredoxin